MQTFPAYLKLLVEGFGEKPEPMIMRSEMESGPPKQAQFISRGMIPRSVNFIAETISDYQSFKAWFTIINHGADWFYWLDPVDGVVKPTRIVGGKYEAVPNKTKFSWRIAMTLETWG